MYNRCEVQKIDLHSLNLVQWGLTSKYYYGSILIAKYFKLDYFAPKRLSFRSKHYI